MFLFLFGFLLQSVLTNFTYYNHSMVKGLIASTAISNSSSTDTCNKMVARTKQIYHINTEGIYQSWTKGSLSTTASRQVIAGVTIRSLWVNYQQYEVIMMTSQASQGWAAYFLKSSGVIDWGFTSNVPLPTYTAFVQSPDYYYILTQENFFTKTTQVSKMVAQVNTIQSSYVTSNSFKHMDPVPNFQFLFLWDDSTTIRVINTTTMNLHQTITPNITPSTFSTKRVTFSNDSTLAIVQTDHYNPLVIYNLTTFSEEYIIDINDVIQSAYFLNNSNEYVIIFGPNNSTLAHLTTNSLYHLPIGSTLESTVDYLNNIFTCYQNTIEQFQLNAIATSSPGQENQGIVQQDFYIDTSLGDSEAYEVINKSLVVALTVSNTMTNVASSIPLSIYFLSFLNYFVLSSLYVLVNFPIPKHIYIAFSEIYKQLNISILSLFGIDVNFVPLSEEKVDFDRATFFGVSSDLFSSHTVTFGVLVANLTIIFLIQWGLSNLKKSNYIRKVWNRQKMAMISGHVVNLIVPMTLPWSFIIMQTGFRDFKTKLNSACYLILFFLGLFFPIYYLFELLQARESELIQERNLRRKQREKNDVSITYKVPIVKDDQNIQEEKPKRSPSVKKSRFHEEKIQKQRQNSQQVHKRGKSQATKKGKKEEVSRPKQSKQVNKKSQQEYKTFKLELKFNAEENRKKLKQQQVTFSKLWSYDLVEQWYLAQANFLYPCLVLLLNPIYFLIVIQAFTILGVVIAFKKKTRRVNSVLLAIYPFLFHLSFIIFYWCSSIYVLAIAQIVCLSSFVIGIAHHLITAIVEIFSFLFTLCKQLCKNSQITPKNKDSKKKRKQKKDGKDKKSKSKSKSKKKTKKQSSTDDKKQKKKQSKSKGKEKTQEESKEKSKQKSKEKTRERSNEKARERSNEKTRERSNEKGIQKTLEKRVRRQPKKQLTPNRKNNRNRLNIQWTEEVTSTF